MDGDAGDLDGSLPTERVIGGTLTQWQTPTGFHAKFFLSGRFVCAGTLITRRHILTAAHCNINANSSVRLGGLKLLEGLELPIGRVTAHPDYQPATSRSDLAVVELGRDVSDAQMKAHNLQLVRLNPWPKLPENGSSPTLTGWGYRIQSPGGTASDQLIKAQLTIIDVKACNARYERLSLLAISTSQELCAGQNGRRSCNGDSGGPLWSVDASRNGKGFVQYGVVSSAIGSKRYPCDSSWPTVFMRTSFYMDWINDTTGKKYPML